MRRPTATSTLWFFFFAGGIALPLGTAEPDVICYAWPDVGIILAPPDACAVASARDARILATADLIVIDVMPEMETILT